VIAEETLMRTGAIVKQINRSRSLARPRRSLLALMAIVAWPACTRVPEAPPPTDVTIVTGGTAGVYFPLGSALAQIYNSKVAGVRASAQATVASVFNVEAIEQGKADVAFVQGDVAYFAYRRGTETNPRPHTRLRGMAVLFVNAVQIVVRHDSDIQRVTDFRGRRIGLGSPGSGTEEAARIIVENHGLNYADVRPGFLSFSEVAEQMQARTLDGGFIVANYPVAAIIDVNRTVGIRLVPIERKVIDFIRERYRFFKPIVIPRGTYENQNKDVTTIAVDNLLVCRDDMPEHLVHDLTKTFFESLPELARTHVAATLIDPEQGPTTSIPLHPGAARYYRERELLQ
jgi:TRAP transporter TAXI family solute receptor